MTANPLEYTAYVMLAALFSFGGLGAVLSELSDSMVRSHGWISADNFSQSYAMATAFPGPNTIFLSLIGYQIAGLWGAFLAPVAWGIPTGAVLYCLGRMSNSTRFPGLKHFRDALVPCVGGLLAAGSITTAKAFDPGIRIHQSVLAVAALTILVWKPKVNPLWVLAGCGLIGVLFLRP